MYKILLLVLFLGVHQIANAAEITLVWDIIPDADGYTLLYGTQSDELTENIDVVMGTEVNGNIEKRKYKVENLILGTTYFFKIKGYTASGVQGELSTGVFGESELGKTSLTME